MAKRKKPEPPELTDQQAFTRDVEQIVEHLEKLAGVLHAVIEPLQRMADSVFEQVIELRKIRTEAARDDVERLLARGEIRRAYDRSRVRPDDEEGEDDGRSPRH